MYYLKNKANPHVESIQPDQIQVELLPDNTRFDPTQERFHLRHFKCTISGVSEYTSTQKTEETNHLHTFIYK